MKNGADMNPKGSFSLICESHLDDEVLKKEMEAVKLGYNLDDKSALHPYSYLISTRNFLR